MTLKYLLFFIAHLAAAPPLTSPLPSLFSLALSCSWEVLQDVGSDRLPIVLTVPLSPIFCPNERPPSLNFQKAPWDDFAFSFTVTVLLQRNTGLFVIPLLLFSLLL